MPTDIDDPQAPRRPRLRVGELIDSVPDRIQSVPDRLAGSHAWRHGRRTLTIVALVAFVLGVMFSLHTADRVAAALERIRDEQTWSSWQHAEGRLVEVSVDGSDVVAVLAIPAALEPTTAVAIPDGRTLSLESRVAVLVSPDGKRVMLDGIQRAPVWTTIVAASASFLGTLLWFVSLLVFCRRSAAVATAIGGRERARALFSGTWVRVVAVGVCVAVPAWGTATVAATSWETLGSTVAEWGLGVTRVITFATFAALLVLAGAWGALWLAANPAGGNATVRRAHRAISSSAARPHMIRIRQATISNEPDQPERQNAPPDEIETAAAPAATASDDASPDAVPADAASTDVSAADRMDGPNVSQIGR